MVVVLALLWLLMVMGVEEKQVVDLAEGIQHYLDSSYTVFLEGSVTVAATVALLWLLMVMGVKEKQVVDLAEGIQHYLDSSYTVFLEG
jgi:Mn-dependent DtxR family transcriptional regulator